MKYAKMRVCMTKLWSAGVELLFWETTIGLLFRDISIFSWVTIQIKCVAVRLFPFPIPEYATRDPSNLTRTNIRRHDTTGNRTGCIWTATSPQSQLCLPFPIRINAFFEQFRPDLPSWRSPSSGYFEPLHPRVLNPLFHLLTLDW